MVEWVSSGQTVRQYYYKEVLVKLRRRTWKLAPLRPCPIDFGQIVNLFSEFVNRQNSKTRDSVTFERSQLVPMRQLYRVNRVTLRK